MSFFRPYNNLGPSLISGVETLTFSIDFVWEDTDKKEIHYSDVDRVPDLKINDYKPAIPTTLPPYASSIP